MPKNFEFDFRYMSYRSKGFEAMKAGKSAIRLWLSCQVTEDTLMNELCVPNKIPNNMTATNT